MTTIPEEIWLKILTYTGFGTGKSRNIVSYRRVNKTFDSIILKYMTIEVDTDKTISIEEFLKIYNTLYITLRQKRNNCIDWDDYRGFFIITDFDSIKWTFYNNLLNRYYNYSSDPSSFPHYKGQMYFYEYP